LLSDFAFSICDTVCCACLITWASSNCSSAPSFLVYLILFETSLFRSFVVDYYLFSLSCFSPVTPWTLLRRYSVRHTVLPTQGLLSYEDSSLRSLLGGCIFRFRFTFITNLVICHTSAVTCIWYDSLPFLPLRTDSISYIRVAVFFDRPICCGSK
jgi:hypothetical protein